MKVDIKKTIIYAIFFVVLISIFIIAIYFAYPYLLLLKNEEGRNELANIINDNKKEGVILLLLFQFLQTTIPFIPGEAIELLSGIILGPIYGLIICLLGLLISTCFIFLIVRRLSFRTKIDEAMSKVLRYNSVRELEVFLFCMFLIPGIPKDGFSYLAACSEIKLKNYIIISLIARVPSIISSTIAGNFIIEGKISLSLIIMIISLILGLLGAIFKKRITKFLETKILHV